MRTLKKTLCLVLVLAMMVGLCAIGASAISFADYPDKDKIEHKEAAAVLTQIGVLQGDEGGFRPADTLTRAEAAAFFTKLCAATGAGTSSFTDMAGSEWAQPYVAYCEANGIINGYGDGTFGPKNPVTVVQWAKMCLAALGYNPISEGWVNNATWEVDIIKLINKIDLAAGIGTLSYDAPITRDEAAQFGFNTLKAYMVEYEGQMTVTTSDGTKVEVGATSKPVTNGSYSYMVNYDDHLMELCENYFPNLKVDDGKADLFGMPTNYWFMGTNRKDTVRTPAKTITSELAGRVLATYDTSVMVPSKTIFADTRAGGSTAKLKVVENGYTLDNDISVGRLLTDYPLAGYAGATIYLLDTSYEGDNSANGYGVGDTLIVKYPYLAQVTKVNAASATADRSVTLKVYNKLAPAACTYTTANYAKGDYILVYTGGAMAATKTATSFPTLSILASEAATPVAGTLTKVTKSPIDGNASALTVGGVSYSIGANANLGPAASTPVNCSPAQYTLNTGLTAYTSNGYILGLVADAVAYGDYVFSIKAVHRDGALSTTYTVGSVDQSGAATEVTATNVGPGSTQVPESALTMTWATKAEGTNGTYSFRPTNLSHVFSFNGNKLSSDTATLGTAGSYQIIADAKTVFVIHTATGWKSYTGLANVPNYTGLKTNSGYALLPDYNGAHAAAVYVEVAGASQTGAETAAIYLLTGAFTDKEAVGKTTVYDYQAIVDGKLTTVQSKDDGPFTPNGLVVPTYEDGYLKSVAKASGLVMDQAYVGTADTDAIVVSAGDITVNGRAYVLAADCVAYVYDAKDYANPLSVGTALDVLDGLNAGYITMTKGSKDAYIKAIYFVKA